MEDFNPLVAALEAEGIVRSPVAVSETGSGGCDLCVEGKNARQVIEKAISEHSLTVRVSKDIDHIYEVYESGKKIREESYTLEKSP